MKQIFSSILFFLIISSIFAKNGIATISNLPWSTTFNCPEWDQAIDGWNTINCDGITSSVGDWYADGHGEQITSDANYPQGLGGRGQRHWMGDSGDGQSTAPGSGELLISFPEASNLWIRFYFRMQNGMPINQIKYWKVLYLYGPDQSSSASAYVDNDDSGLGMRLYDRSVVHTGTYGFDDVYGSSTSDGSWHALEYHFDITNGVFEYWFYQNGIDAPIPKYRSTTVSLRMPTISLIKFPENHKTAEGLLPIQTMYIDFDDIAISSSGRIGPIGSNVEQKPLPPSGLRLTQ